MIKLTPVIISILIIGLFLLSKLLPYKDKLSPKYRKAFDFFNSVLSPTLNLLKKIIKPIQVGTGLSVDMSQIVLLVVLLIALNFI